MKCLVCQCDQFATENQRFSPSVKGETVEVVIPCMTCQKCHSPLMSAEQMNLLRKAAADKYRELHEMLTSSQILAYREELGMSQSAFARYLSVGEASIKRWETYYVQDASQDELIRLKCDIATAEMNFLDVHWKREEPGAFNGKRKFSFEIFKNVALYLVKHVGESIIILNKIHFYADFLHFKKYGTSLTGVRYATLKYGPCPDQYKAIYDMLVSAGYLKERSNHKYDLVHEPNLSVFDDKEKETLDAVISECKRLGPQKIYELSHKERGYEETEECSFIDYKFAKDLLLPDTTKGASDA